MNGPVTPKPGRPDGSNRGLTLVEVLIALVVVAVAFFALALTQVSNLRATARSSITTDVKAAANRVLEQRVASVLRTDSDEVSSTSDPATLDPVDASYDLSGGGRRDLNFWFIDHYYGCPDVDKPASVRSLRDVACTGTEDVPDTDITVNWDLEGREGVLGEGLVSILVEARHVDGATFVIGDSISCYDVFPTPTSDTPAPCPRPYDPATGTGGGRDGSGG